MIPTAQQDNTITRRNVETAATLLIIVGVANLPNKKLISKNRVDLFGIWRLQNQNAIMYVLLVNTQNIEDLSVWIAVLIVHIAQIKMFAKNVIKLWVLYTILTLITMVRALVSVLMDIIRIFLNKDVGSIAEYHILKIIQV